MTPLPCIVADPPLTERVTTPGPSPADLPSAQVDRLVWNWTASPAPNGRGEDATGQARLDTLAEETPVALVCNGVTQAVMLASPTDLEDLALGLAFTEGWIGAPSELRAVEIVPVAGGLEARMEISAAAEWRLRSHRRALAGRTGCGLCGTESLAQVHRTLAPVQPPRTTQQAVAAALAALPARQVLQRTTGATHAAAWCSLDGRLQDVREDVGRHNALDKLIGSLLRRHAQTHDGFVLVTSRASFELVQKCAAAGIGMLVAVSAPTGLAVQTAQALGVALAGFARGQAGVIYHRPECFGTGSDRVG